MNRYEIENAAEKVKGYYSPPSPADLHKATVPERFEAAKQEALKHMRKAVEDVENLTIAQCFPTYRKRT